MSIARNAIMAATVLLLLGVLVSRADYAGDEWSLNGMWYSIANADDVRAIARQGNDLWVATASGGVARWTPDGVFVRQYLAPQDGLPCNDVRDAVVWRGRMWFATCDGLAVHNPKWDRMEMVSATLPSPSVTALEVDAQDRLWVATDQWWDADARREGTDERGDWTGGGVAYSSDGLSWTTVGVTDGLVSANARDVHDWNGSIWVATEPYSRWVPPSGGVDGDEDGHWEHLGGGLAQFDGTSWRVHDSDSNAEISNNTVALASTASTLWVGTRGRGLVAHAGGQWKALQDCGDDQRCISDDFVTALAVSDDGAVWVGTSRFNGRGTGAAVLDDAGTPTDPDDDAWHAIRAGDGLPGDLVHAILPDTDATVWFGVAHRDPEGRVQGRGLAHLLNDRMTLETFSVTETTGGALAGNDITAIARDPASGAIWIGTGRSGVSVLLPSGQWETYTSASTMGGLGSDSIADIAIEDDGTVWVATRQTEFDATTGRWSDGGLSRFDGLQWKTIRSSAGGMPSNHLSALELDGRGKLWVGTGATDRGPKELAHRGWGLAVIDTTTQQWERTFTFPTLPSNNITDIEVSGSLVWVATSYFFYVDTRPGGAQIRTGGGLGVYNLDTGQWNKITTDQGLTPALRERSSSRPLLDLRTVHVDPQGGAWVGGMAYPHATFKAGITPDGVIDIVGTDRVESHRFDSAGAVLALEEDGNGFVWAATLEDGVWVRAGTEWLQHERRRGGLPSNRVTRLSFDGGQVWLGTAGDGLVRLVSVRDAGTAEPGVPPQPTSPPDYAPVVIQQLPNRIFLPAAKRDVLGDIIMPPDSFVGGAGAQEPFVRVGAGH